MGYYFFLNPFSISGFTVMIKMGYCFSLKSVSFSHVGARREAEDKIAPRNIDIDDSDVEIKDELKERYLSFVRSF